MKKVREITIPISHIKHAISEVDYECGGRIHTTKFDDGLLKISLPNAVSNTCPVKIIYEESQEIS